MACTKDQNGRTEMANGDFGPWDYRGYTIERYLGESGPAEYVITKSGGDEIACFGSKFDAQCCIDDLISDAAEFYAPGSASWCEGQGDNN